MARTNGRTRWLCQDCGLIGSQQRIQRHADESGHRDQITIRQGPSPQAAQRAAYTNALRERDLEEKLRALRRGD